MTIKNQAYADVDLLAKTLKLDVFLRNFSDQTSWHGRFGKNGRILYLKHVLEEIEKRGLVIAKPTEEEVLP